MGQWQIDRLIEPVGTAPARFNGAGVWSKQDDDVWYHEKGTLRMAGAMPMQAERRYLWRGLDVYFEDGRFFHSVPPQGGSATHHCNTDTYHVSYEFSEWPAFTATWRVYGPRKDYTMRSRYTRS